MIIIAIMGNETGLGAKEKDAAYRDKLVFADETVSYQQLFQVLDQLKRANMTKIS